MAQFNLNYLLEGAFSKYSSIYEIFLGGGTIKSIIVVIDNLCFSRLIFGFVSGFLGKADQSPHLEYVATCQVERSELILNRDGMQWGMGRRAGCSQREHCIWVGFRPNSFQAGIPCWRHRFPRQQLWDMVKPGALKAIYPKVHNGSIRFTVKLQSQDQQEMDVLCPEIPVRKPFLTLCGNQKSWSWDFKSILSHSRRLLRLSRTRELSPKVMKAVLSDCPISSELEGRISFYMVHPCLQFRIPIPSLMNIRVT